MNSMIAFAIAAVPLAIGNTFCVLLFNKKRQALDLTKPEDAKKDKVFKLLTIVLPIETIVVSVILYFILIESHA